MGDMTESDKAKSAKYLAIFGTLSVLFVCGFFSIFVYSYYSNPRPEDPSVRQYIESRTAELDKRIRLLEDFNKNLKLLVEIKQHVDHQ